MPTTTRGYRYPAGSDAPNGPAAIGNLASDLDADVGAIATKLDGWIYGPRARKTTIETVSSATTGSTLQDDDELFFSVAANAVYEIRGLIRIASQTVADFKMGFSAPSGSTLDWSLHSINSSGSTTNDDFLGGGYVLSSVPAVAGLGSTTVIAKMEGMLVTAGSAGTFKLRWAQNTADASGTSVLANSILAGLRWA